MRVACVFLKEVVFIRLPEMILFDYGNTILYEQYVDGVRGHKAVFEHLTKNPDNVTPEQVNELGGEIFKRLNFPRNSGFEIHQRFYDKLQYEYFGLEFDIPYEEIEQIFWKNASEIKPMPGVEKMLAYLREKGIRSGVVSNLGWSGNALKTRIDECLPDNRFEFVIASSEYIFRKPDRLIFELALRKAGLAADKVWFCGDTVSADVDGAHNVGIFPVWYDDKTIPCPWKTPCAEPDYEHLHIDRWESLTDILEKLK